MRITGGKAAGIRLDTPAGKHCRPTADRVRESLFAILGPLEGMRVADLFAGTGALGLEALSRGAATAAFVEQNPRALAVLHQNVQRVLHCLDRTPPAPATVVRKGNAYRADKLLRRNLPTPNLIVADPPYEDCGRKDRVPAWLRSPQLAGWAENATLVLEHPRGSPLPWYPESPWRPVRQKHYGETQITVARLADNREMPCEAGDGTVSEPSDPCLHRPSVAL